MVRLFGLAALLWAASAPAFALGSAAIGNEDISARSLGMGGVGIAQADDATAAFFNPAALPFLQGYSGTAGATLIVPDVTYRTSAGDTGMRSLPLIAPNFALSAPLVKDRLSAGLAVEAPFGGDFQYSDTGPMRYLATKAILNMIDITPSVGYKLTDDLSVGASLHYYDFFDVTRVNAVDQTLINGSASPDAAADLHATGQKLGYGGSIYWKPLPKHAFGLTYRSQETINLTGSLGLSGLTGTAAALFGGSSYSTDAQANFAVPATVQMGWSFTPNDRWTVEADAAWYGWSAYHSLTVNFPSEPSAQRQGVLTTNSEGTTGGEPKNWYNVTSGAIGAEYKACENLRLRGGYAYQPATGPASTWHPEELDLTRHEFTVGAGLKTQPVDVDLSYMLIYLPRTQITNNVGAPTALSGGPGGINGYWFGVAHLVALNLSKRF